jgi:hypothetical protein
MKELLTQLMLICPGRLAFEIDRHKLHGETAEEVIFRQNKLDYGPDVETMKQLNTIVRVEALPVTKQMPIVITYSHDLELALQYALNEINEWKQKK